MDSSFLKLDNILTDIPDDDVGWCSSDDNGYYEVTYLVGAIGKEHCVEEDLFTCFKCKNFGTLPGVGELDGTKWNGVTAEDITNAAFSTWWYKNGQANKERPDEETDINADSMMDELINVDIQAAGLVWLPVCNDDEAHKNWEDSLNGKGKTDIFPCN